MFEPFDSPPPVADQFRELFHRHQRLLRDLTALLTEWREAQIPDGQAMGLLEEALARVTIPVEPARPPVTAEPSGNCTVHHDGTPGDSLPSSVCRECGDIPVPDGSCRTCPSCGRSEGACG